MSIRKSIESTFLGACKENFSSPKARSPKAMTRRRYADGGMTEPGQMQTVSQQPQQIAPTTPPVTVTPSPQQAAPQAVAQPPAQPQFGKVRWNKLTADQRTKEIARKKAETQKNYEYVKSRGELNNPEIKRYWEEQELKRSDDWYGKNYDTTFGSALGFFNQEDVKQTQESQSQDRFNSWKNQSGRIKPEGWDKMSPAQQYQYFQDYDKRMGPPPAEYNTWSPQKKAAWANQSRDEHLKESTREGLAMSDKSDEEHAKKYPGWENMNDAARKAIIMREFYVKGSEGTGKKNFLMDIGTQAMDPMMQKGLGFVKDTMVDAGIGALTGGGVSGVVQSGLQALPGMIDFIKNGDQARYEGADEDRYNREKHKFETLQRIGDAPQGISFDDYMQGPQQQDNSSDGPENYDQYDEPPGYHSQENYGNPYMQSNQQSPTRPQRQQPYGYGQPPKQNSPQNTGFYDKNLGKQVQSPYYKGGHVRSSRLIGEAQMTHKKSGGGYMAGETPSRKRPHTDYEASMNGERKEMAMGGVGKIRHGVMTKAGKAIKPK